MSEFVNTCANPSTSTFLHISANEMSESDTILRIPIPYTFDDHYDPRTYQPQTNPRLKYAYERLELLKFWLDLCKQAYRIRIIMKEGHPVYGTLVAVNSSLSHFLINNLETSLGLYPSVKLRASDMTAIEVVNQT
ncbi:hypothetical protein BKA69DRAFT_1125698 [Paraphysoderma sedebokerense]|nr:hypothetical protein BKA69DRAFT_1125698 [Paraphysoderma sedebokerense]